MAVTHWFQKNLFHPFCITLLWCSLLVSSCSNPTMQNSDEEGTVVTSGRGAAITSLSGGAPQLGIVVDEQLIVLEVEPESAAALAGVQRGDQLKSLADLSIPDNHDKIKEVIHIFKEGDKALRLQLVRDGKEISVEVSPSFARFVAPSPNEGPPPTATPVLPPNDYF